MQFDLTAARENRGLDIRVTLINRGDTRIDRGFSQHGDAQGAGKQMCWRNLRAQTLARLVFEDPLHLMRRPRQQKNDVFAPVEFSREPLAGSSAVGIWQNRRSVQNVGLLGIVGRHFPAALREPLLQARQNLVIPAQAHPEGLGNGLPGEIVFGRPKTTAENYDIGAEQRMLRGSNQPPQVVSHDALENDVNSQLVELIREIQGIGIHAVGSQHLGTHRDDFGVHALAV